MPPYLKNANDNLDDIPDLEPIAELDSKQPNEKNVEEEPYRIRIVWRNVILMSVLHLSALYGLYLSFVAAKWQTNVAAFLFYQFSGLGITAGCHRLWSHRSYKARLPLRIFLAALQTMALQNHIYEWSRDHRVHHKYSETDADPHNSKRGFFFAHIGWLLVRKHPEVIRKGSQISLDDLLRDPVVRFQRKYYVPLVLLMCFILPTIIPHLLWDESLYNAFYICALFRLAWTLHMTWFVNSAAHFWGRHPYDNTISPAENLLTIVGAGGEGFHNYHHTFPWDYATSELGWRYNASTMFINAMEKLGLAYDLKTVSPEMIRQRKARTGDVAIYGNYGLYHPNEEDLKLKTEKNKDA